MAAVATAAVAVTAAQWALREITDYVAASVVVMLAAAAVEVTAAAAVAAWLAVAASVRRGRAGLQQRQRRRRGGDADMRDDVRRTSAQASVRMRAALDALRQLTVAPNVTSQVVIALMPGGVTLAVAAVASSVASARGDASRDVYSVAEGGGRDRWAAAVEARATCVALAVLVAAGATVVGVWAWLARVSR